MRQLTNHDSHYYENPKVIEEAFQWRLEEKERDGDPAGPGLQRRIKADLEDPAEVRSILQRKAQFQRREREAEVGSREALERSAASSENQRRRRILHNAHAAGGCQCLGRFGPTEHCGRPKKLKYPAPPILKNPTPEWNEAYLEHLTSREVVNIPDWVAALGEGLARKCRDAEDIKGEGFCGFQVEKIERELEERFKGRFDLYGDAYWNNTALRQIARDRFEQVVNKALREREGY